MNMEQEIQTYLEKTIKDSPTKNRNIDIVTSYYGFRDAIWPTLEEVAAEYSIGTRERVRQILNKCFRDHAKPEYFPATLKCAEILKSYRHISAEEYKALISKNNTIWTGKNIQGLLNLMHDLTLSTDFGLYTNDFQPLTRTLIKDCAHTYLIRTEDAESYRKAFLEACGLPGSVGVANLKHLASKQNWTEEKFSIIKNSISKSTKAWFKEIGEDFWYAFENRENILLNFSEKVYATVQATQADQLSKIYRNALQSRTNEHLYPPAEIIQLYLTESVFFDHNDGFIKYTPRNPKLTDIESAIVAYFRGHKNSSYESLKEHLEKLGFSSSLIVKSTMNSPLVHVDKSLGRSRYIYSLVSNYSERPLSTSEARYKTTMARLRKLIDGTDEDIETTRRKEHHILQEWLFKGKNTEHCAICGDEFDVSALITAHKKKRTLCSPAERLDPNIVMPLCALGCDYLYERGYLYIKNGRITVNQSLASSTTEYVRAKNLDGRILKEAWRMGSDDYFQGPGLN